MRIAIATTSYPADGDDPSGHFVRAHARELAQGGAEVVVVAPGPRAHAAEERAGDGFVRVVRVGGADLFGWPGAVARARANPTRLGVLPFVAARALQAIRREGPFDRAVAHWIPCAHLLTGTGAPLLAVAHGADVRLLLGLPRIVRVALVRSLLAEGARFRFVATALRNDLLVALPADVRSALAARSVIEAAPFDLPSFESLDDPRAELGLEGGAPYVAWLGRLVPGKRPLLAVDAARLAHRTLVMVGDGPLYPGLAREAGRDTTLARARLVLAGRLPRGRALAVMSRASAVLHTSASEGASTVVREARALGIPVVACASGDLAAWAACDPGISVAAAEASSIASALEHALSSARSIAHHGGAT